MCEMKLCKCGNEMNEETVCAVSIKVHSKHSRKDFFSLGVFQVPN